MADEDLSTPVASEPASAPTIDNTDVELSTEEPRELPADVGDEPAPETPDDSGDGDDLTEELEEFEWNGKTIKGPKGLKDGVLMQADYTKKTQTVAEKAKELDAREAAISQQAEATEAELDARATLKGVTSRLAEYAKLTAADWQHHMQTDPLGTQQARMEFDDLKAQKAELEGVVNMAGTERTEKAQQDLAKRVQETIAVAQKEIPNWKPELTDTLVKYALDKGVPEDAIKANWSPVFYKLLYEANIGAQTIAKQAAPKPAPKPAITPLATVKAATSPATSKSLADLANGDDMEAYAARRAAQSRR